MPKIYMLPRAPEDVAQATNGILQVVIALEQYLPAYGWSYVAKPEQADLLVSNASSVQRAHVEQCHGLHPTAELQSPKKWYFGINERVIESVRHARRVTVPSPWVGELFARDMNFMPRIIGHGIELELWPEPKPLGERTPQHVVLWNKNRASDVCDPLAVEQLADLCPDISFVSTFGEQAPNLQTTGLVSHAEMKKLLYNSFIYYAPTKETFGIGVVEALAAGLPVLCWDWGNTPHLVKHKVTGYVAKPDDYEDTVEGLRYCISHWKEMAEAARESARGHDWSVVIPKYDKVYREALVPHEGPLVTFVIPCYNYEKYVAGAIQSVKGQAISDWECIVVDDGSTDDSLSRIKAACAGDKRFKIAIQKNRGVAAARNRGAVLGQGKYLAFLDADDEVTPNFITELVPALEKDRSLVLTYGFLTIVHPNGNEINGQWPSGDFNFNQQLRRRNQVPTCCMMRREFFIRSGGFRQRLRPAEDAELWTRMGLLGGRMSRASHKRIFRYRIHQGSATDQQRKGTKEPDWRSWLSGANGGPQPFASLAKPAGRLNSHPVRNYDQPQVSVVIPVGDGHERNVLNAIDSVSAQTFPYWECIIVDDTTEGELWNKGIIPYRTAFPFAKWVRSNTQNASSARNMGAKVARAPWLVFLDADDVLYKDFLAVTLTAARTEGPGMYYTDWIALPKEETHVADNFSLKRMMTQALFAVTFLHPKESWEAVGGFDESLSGWEDWDYTIALALAGWCGQRVPGFYLGYDYTSGFRRKQSLDQKDMLLRRIRNKWKGVQPMGCRGCGGRRSRPSRVRATARTPLPARRDSVRLPVAAGSAPLVDVEYKGTQEAAQLFKVPSSGNRYRFGGRHKRKLVLASDATFFASRDDFEVHPRGDNVR